jgi:predicted ribosome quality control (RQC) complex YloA/Tae2 family protein
MKQGMTNVDVAALAAELAPLLVGARLDKAYQPAKEQVLLRLRRKGTGKQDLLIELGRFATLTRRPPQNPDRPSMVAQILRTTFENSRLTNLQQVGFDRLLRLDFERGDGRHSIVVELFGDGNLLILDAEGKILLPMRGEDHGARKLRKGEPYQPPPGSAWPFDLDAAALRAKAEGSKDLVRFLALGLGFGPLWAEELCLRAGLDKRAAIADLAPESWQALHKAIAVLGHDLRRNDLAPAIVYEEGKPVDAVPFVMAKYPAPRFTHEEAPTFREALDVLFVGAGGDEDSEEPDDPRRPRYEEARGKVQQQLRMMDDAIAGFVAKETEDQLDGDALYASFGEVQSVLDALNKARLERSWTEIEATLAKGRAEGNPFARQVTELRPHAGIAVLALTLPDGTTRKVAVDLRRTVQENAEACYAAAKKSRSRRDGAETARRDAEGRLRAIENAGLDAFGAAPVRAERQSRHFWFEGYRWALTPSGLLAVGGRNGGQNDQVVKKYLRDGDRYVHADVHGAPSVVVRPADGPPAADIPAEDLRVACQFAVCASRAWRQGGSASAYWVTPAQVSKTPRSGEYVPRGAWMVHGKRNIEEHLPLEWAVGLVEFESDGKPVPPGTAAKGRSFRKLAGGPPAGLLPFATDLLRVLPGTQDPNDAAAALAERYGVAIEEALAALPAGPVLIEGLAARPRSTGTAEEDA